MSNCDRKGKAVYSAPKCVRLTEDFIDPPTNMHYVAGTLLFRTTSGQYVPEGVGLGERGAVAGFFLIRDICEPVE